VNEDLVFGSPVIGHRWFQRVVRNKLLDRLKENGFGDIGKDATPFAHDHAKSLVAKIEDDDIMLAATTVGALGDGTLGGRLKDLMDWVIAHKEQIMIVVKMILSLLMMFI